MIYPETVYKIRGIVFDIFNNVVGNWNENVFENIKQCVQVIKYFPFIRLIQNN